MTKRPTTRQLQSALDTLAAITETEDLTGRQRDAIANVRSALHDLVERREHHRKLALGGPHASRSIRGGRS